MFKQSFTYFILAFLLFGGQTFAQSKKQQQLEERRQELRQEIKRINDLLSQNKSKAKSQTSRIEDISYKVSVRKNLIKVTNQQANLLTREISDNQNKISSLRAELQTLKDNYAKMLVTSYKSKNKQSRVMFLLSSNSFQQAYKRVQYINQYAEYQKEQGVAIKAKTKTLQDLNTSLLKQKADKQELIAENRIAQSKLETELKEQQTLMAAIQKDVDKYASQIRTRQSEINRINKQIKALIREAIVKSNKKSGKTTTSKTTKFALTPEGKALAKSFAANKGKLSWPVEKGFVKVRYGTQPHPVLKTIKIQSSGVRIATEPKAKVRAVFKGEVMGVQVSKGANPRVLIRHGNYITVYKNLSKVAVKKGDKITTNQVIGEVFTNPKNQETILSFMVFKDDASQNPANWIYGM